MCGGVGDARKMENGWCVGGGRRGGGSAGATFARKGGVGSQSRSQKKKRVKICVWGGRGSCEGHCVGGVESLSQGAVSVKYHKRQGGLGVWKSAR